MSILKYMTFSYLDGIYSENHHKINLSLYLKPTSIDDRSYYIEML